MFAIYTLLSVIQMSYAQARMAVALDSATKQVAEYTHIYFALGLDETFTGQGGASSDWPMMWPPFWKTGRQPGAV